MVAVDSGFMAVGYDSDGLGLWRSDTGELWQRSHGLEVPPGVELSDASIPWGVSQLQLFDLEGSTVVFGWVGEVSVVWLDGEFRGVIDEFRAPPWVIAGEQLLALVVAPPEGTEQPEREQFEESWFLSDNGLDRTPFSPSGLPEAGVHLIGWVDGFYYASSGCGPDNCSPPSLYRSGDGATWEATDVEVPGPVDSGFGQVTDVAQVGERLLAIGTVDSGAGWEPAMWGSPSGQHWVLAPLADAFHSNTTTVELVATNSTYEGTAIVSIDGVEYELPKESVIETDAGRIVVTAIGRDSIVVRVGTQGSHRLDQGVPLTLHPTPLLYDIAAHQSRVAIRGRLATSDDGDDSFWSTAPAVWLSEDSGATWELSIIDESETAFINSMALSSGSISMTGNTDNGSPVAWHNQRDTQGSR